MVVLLFWVVGIWDWAEVLEEYMLKFESLFIFLGYQFVFWEVLSKDLFILEESCDLDVLWEGLSRKNCFLEENCDVDVMERRK